MTEPLTAEGYEQTKEKLRDLEERLAAIDKRTDLTPEHLARVRRSYKMMMRECLQDITLHEARQTRSLDALPNRSRLKVKGCILLVIVVCLSLVYGVYPYFNPYNHVATVITDIPAGTTFVCLVADTKEGTVVMPLSAQKVFPFTVHPDKGASRKPDSVSPEWGPVRWVANRRVGVLLRSESGVWRVKWFDSARSELQDRSLLFGGGWWRASLRDAAEEEVIDKAQLRALGFDYALKEEGK